MRFQDSNESGSAPLAPLAKVGFAFPTLAFPYAYRNPIPRKVASLAPQAAIADPKHAFVIRGLSAPALLKPRSWVCFCLRCKYLFLVSKGRGSLVALDRKAQPMAVPENSQSAATFARGPCLALTPTAQAKRHRVIELSTSTRRLSLTGIFAAIIRTVAKTRYPYFVESKLSPPDGITPQDLLS